MFGYVNHERVSGVAVSIVAFQAIDPGSTPGWRSTLFLHLLCNLTLTPNWWETKYPHDNDESITKAVNKLLWQ